MHAIGYAAAAFVEQDQAAEGGEAFEEGGHRRQLPHIGQVRYPAQDEDQVEWTVADDLVGDVDVAAASVLGPCEHVGRASLSPDSCPGWVVQRFLRHAAADPFAEAVDLDRRPDRPP